MEKINEIKVIDKFLLKDELNVVKNKLNQLKWSFGHTSTSDLNNDTPFWISDLMNDNYFTEYIKLLIEKQFDKKFEIVRVYCNGQTFGQDGSYHIDSDEPNCYTFCLYVNHIKPHNIELACGYIYFKFPELDYKICYEPIDNRGIFFPSNYLHKSTAFTRFIKELRMCIAYKLREIKNY